MTLAHLTTYLATDTWQNQLVTTLQACSGKIGAHCEDVPAAARVPLLAALALRWHGPMLIVTPRPDQADELAELLRIYLPSSLAPQRWPVAETLPYDVLLPDIDVGARQVAILWRLLSDVPQVVIAPARALGQLVGTPEALQEHLLELRVGMRLSPVHLVTSLLDYGYRRVGTVSEVGHISQRGGIVDIWPATSEYGLRIEFFDDEIDSLRWFDPSTQRSVERTDAALILPARLASQAAIAQACEQARQWNTATLRSEVKDEWNKLLGRLERGELSYPPELLAPLIYQPAATILDYLRSEQHLTVILEPANVRLALEQLALQAEDLRRTLEESGELPYGLPQPYLPLPAILTTLQQKRQFLLGQRPEDWPSETIPLPAHHGYSADIPLLLGHVDELPALVRARQQQGWRIVVVTEQRERITEILEEQDIFPRFVQHGNSETGDGTSWPPGTVEVVRERLTSGWQHERCRLIVLTDRELFGYRRVVHRHAQRVRSRSDLLQQLQPGCYVVHVEHGIARYGGLVTLEVSGVNREYLLLEYAQNDRLYLPVDQLDRITLYEGPDSAPQLTRLGSPDWARVKRRVRQAVRELAFDLLQLYALREAAEGIAFPPDTTWDIELAESFPYHETPDQWRAIQEVKADMEQPKPMDRLLCGDVGFGKTEVALRAAFKAVNAGYQVAVLVPTTILTLQHYTTFQQRLAPFPVRIEMLSRLRSRAEQRHILAGLERGEVDIVIGTHRLIQADVRFKRLGLVIIDEEHRFGVAQKEHFKRLRTNVDVLTLTATPIPRTLYLALSGVRDLSIIATPPQDRVPVRTFVTPARDTVIREAILRELNRGGQVYIVHNRVQSIYHFASKIQQLVPEARVAVAHGQMNEDELESIVLAFLRQEYDVLVCTTIIESGVDMPNVNTIIIDRAHQLGLTQLYQLRGRVGRSHQRAYAYFLYDAHQPLSPEAQARLEAIQEATELGAGFQIALRDLEIRGAGDILGPEQSGHIAAVGFELYTQLLAQAVEEIRQGRPLEEPPSVTVDLPVEATIPENYCGDPAVRMELYQRFARARKMSELRELEEELRDRFGPLPEPVTKLIELARLRIRASHIGISAIMKRDGEIFIRPVIGARINQDALRRQLGPGVYVTPNQVRLIISRLKVDWWDAMSAVLRTIEDVGATLLLAGDD